MATYKDMPKEVGEGAITRYFPAAEYSEKLVREALDIARSIVRGKRAYDTCVDDKDRRPPWGVWDGRHDFRTGSPLLCGVEVTVPDGNGKKVAVMIRHNATGSIPGGDPCGLSREVVTYKRPWSWEERLVYESWDGGEQPVFVAGPRPTSGWLQVYYANPPGQETAIWYPTRLDACESVSDPDARVALLGEMDVSDQTPEGSTGRLRWAVVSVREASPRYFSGE